MQDGKKHRKTKDLLARAFTAAAINDVLKPLCERLARDAVENGKGLLDAIRGLITAIPVKVSREYYGFDIEPHEERDFAEWAIAFSTMYFADFTGSRELRRQTLIAAAKMQRLTDRSIEIANHPDSQSFAAPAWPAQGGGEKWQTVKMGCLSGQIDCCI